MPESVRQYYLDSMGITCWQSQQNLSAEADGPIATDDVGMDPDVSSRWKDLEESVSTCSQCGELSQSRTQTVFGIGNREADLLVIGEAPGQEEDRQGQPFVGPAGQLLTAMLRAIDIDREETYIANILKCRPPENRDPMPDEAQNCSHYLKQQIALIEPRAILVVGRVAAHNLLSTDIAISKLRGQTFSFLDIPVFVTYHPSYLLRKPSEKRKAWHDLLRLQEHMKQWQ